MNDYLGNLIDELKKADPVRLRKCLCYQLGMIYCSLIWEPCDVISRKQFTDMAEAFMRTLQQAGVIHDFHVRCDEIINPPARIDKGEICSETRYRFRPGVGYAKITLPDDARGLIEGTATDAWAILSKILRENGSVPTSEIRRGSDEVAGRD